MRGRISILHLERALILFPLLVIVWVTGCGEEEKAEPVYLIDYTSEGIPGSSLKVWFSGEVISVKFNGHPADKIYFDEKKGFWCARWKLPSMEELIIGYDIILVYVEWTDAIGRTKYKVIAIPSELIPPEVARTNPKDGSTVNAEEVNRKGIIVEFSDQIDTERNGDMFTLMDSKGRRLDWSVSWSSDCIKATLKPKEGMELKPGEVYVLVVENYYNLIGYKGEKSIIIFFTADD